MTVIKIYADNGELLEIIDEHLTAENLPTYAEQNSTERVLGYLDCLTDMTEGLGDVVYRPDHDHSWPDTNHNTKKKAMAFFLKNHKFLELFKAFAEKLPSADKSPDGNNPTPTG